MKDIISIVAILVLLVSCAKSNSAESEQQDVPSVRIERFDKEFYNYLTNPQPETLNRIKTWYKDFLPAFGRITINNSDSYKDEFYVRLVNYFSNDMLFGIYKDTEEKFSDISNYEQELGRVKIKLSEILPGKSLPLLNMHVSGFKENVIVLENILSVSIDKYLGEDYPLYNRFFENYQLVQMQPKMIIRDYLRAWLLSERATNKQTNLLQEMVYEGSLLYILSQLLPDWQEYDILGFTPEQLKWCEENEKRIWTTIIEQSHLYEQDYMVISNYMNHAPYTTTLVPESPGRVGAWVGLQIVKAYISKNNVQVSGLLNTDSQKVLKDSKYNP